MPIVKLEGIVIDVVRHNDRHNVVSLFTRSHGRISFLSAVGTGKSGRMRNSRLMPLSAISTEANLRANRNLQTLGAVTPLRVWHDIYSNPVKTAITFFISEFLNRYLRDSYPDAAAWDFIFASLEALDSGEIFVPNFHIWFMVRFLDFSGIRPELSDFQPGDAFDMRAGRAVPPDIRHSDILLPEEAIFLPRLLRITLTNMRHFSLSGAERSRILSLLLRYYAIHFPGLSNLKSPAILSELFNA